MMIHAGSRTLRSRTLTDPRQEDHQLREGAGRLDRDHLGIWPLSGGYPDNAYYRAEAIAFVSATTASAGSLGIQPDVIRGNATR
ncbi:MAG TPA: hypothetical protein VI365_22230 [Trebonia sp.]